jgi:hypothetical protein
MGRFLLKGDKTEQPLVAFGLVRQKTELTLADIGLVSLKKRENLTVTGGYRVGFS